MNEQQAAETIRRLPETDVHIAAGFMEPETKFCSEGKLVKDKDNNPFWETTPTKYIEINAKDLRTGNIMRWVDLTAILKNLGAARAVRSLGIQTGVDYSPTHNLSVERAISRAGIGLSMNAKLLEELQQHHIVSESTEHLTQNIAPEQPKKRFILF